jgi:fatty-acyl-CoA synthase
MFCGVPTMLIALLAHPDLPRRDLSCVRYAVSGGAPVPADLVRRVEAAVGAPFAITFAQTEAHCSITLTRLDDDAADRAETVGRPLAQTEVKIADPSSGATVPWGATGEVCARGYLVMDGYLDDPAATSAAVDPDGWLHTGDLGSMDERGFCRISGRVKDMIIRGGENIYPSEIEVALFAHPAVADVAVVGYHEDGLQRPRAFVVAAPAAVAGDELAATLKAHVRSMLSPHKYPRDLRFVAELPKTGSGKVDRQALREVA